VRPFTFFLLYSTFAQLALCFAVFVFVFIDFMALLCFFNCCCISLAVVVVVVVAIII